MLVPIDRRSTYADTRHFAEIVAGAIARAHPPRHDRMGEGEAARSARRLEPEPAEGDERHGVLGAAERGRAGLGPAALGRGRRGARPDDVTMDAVLERVDRHGDLFAGVLGDETVALTRH